MAPTSLINSEADRLTRHYGAIRAIHWTAFGGVELVGDAQIVTRLPN